MIRIERKDTMVVLNFDSALNVSKPVYPLVWDAKDENNAELLKEHLRKRLYAVVQEIQRNAYDNGYKDGRGKDVKEEWFSGEL